MFARIVADVGSRIARTIRQGKMVFGRFSTLTKAMVSDEDLKKQASTAVIVIGVAAGSWSLGRLSVEGLSNGTMASSVEIKNIFKDAEDRFTCAPPQSLSSPLLEVKRGDTVPQATPPAAGAVVGSKNSTKYHLQSCSGAKSIKEENKIWFASEAAAQAAGYTRAGNCK